MLVSLGLLSVLASAALVAADDVVTSLDLQAAGNAQPPTAWTSSSLGSCGVSEVSTSTPGANLTVNFTGHKIRVSGLLDNTSGILGVRLDNDLPRTIDLYANESSCDLLFEYDAENGPHTMVLVFLGSITLEGIVAGSSLHITEITYWTGDGETTIASSSAVGTPAPVATSTPTADAGDSGHHADVDGIVGGVVSSVVGLALVVAAIFWYLRRRKASRRASRYGPGSWGRHDYNPNTFYATHVPSSSQDVKLSPYLEMENRDVKHGDPDSPLPAYMPHRPPSARVLGPQRKTEEGDAV